MDNVFDDLISKSNAKIKKHNSKKTMEHTFVLKIVGLDIKAKDMIKDRFDKYYN